MNLIFQFCYPGLDPLMPPSDQEVTVYLARTDCNRLSGERFARGSLWVCSASMHASPL
jgi:hypothetical protein